MTGSTVCAAQAYVGIVGNFAVIMIHFSVFLDRAGLSFWDDFAQELFEEGLLVIRDWFDCDESFIKFGSKMGDSAGGRMSPTVTVQNWQTVHKENRKWPQALSSAIW